MSTDMSVEIDPDDATGVEVDPDDAPALEGDDPFLPLDDGHLDRGVRLFDGDTGTLDLPARKAFQALLKWTFISARRYPQEWKAFQANRAEIVSRLNDLLLEVVVDNERQVAFKRQASADGPGNFTTVLYDSRWSREETILLVHLRAAMRASTAAGHTRAFVERDDLLEHLALMRPVTATNRTADKAAGERAIAALHAAGVLEGRKDSDRLEIDRAIEILLPLERLEELLTWIKHRPTTTDLEAHEKPDSDNDRSSLL